MTKQVKKTKKTKKTKKVTKTVGKLPTGSTLVREYKGKKFTVEILAEGYRMGGKDFPSLTALAKQITGYSAISGPAFFKGAVPSANGTKE
jgi:Protein of unknown function (DUF2924)